MLDWIIVVSDCWTVSIDRPQGKGLREDDDETVEGARITNILLY